MGHDYIIKNILEVVFKTGKMNITLEEMKCYFKETDAFEVNSDCSDYDSDDFYNKKYLSTESYGKLEIYNESIGWRNEKIKNKHSDLLLENDVDLKNVISIVKKQIRYMR